MSSTPAAKKASSSKPKAAPAHPPYVTMIQEAIKSLQERGGSSRQKIFSFIKKNYSVGPNADTQVKLALRRAVKSGTLLQTKGTGASGSFKLGAKPKPPAKPKAVQSKKPAAAAAKKPTAKPKTTQKKESKSKKPAAKSPAKKKASVAKKTPEKKAAKKTQTKKPVKKPGTPKKPAAKKVTKKQAAKK